MNTDALLVARAEAVAEVRADGDPAAGDAAEHPTSAKVATQAEMTDFFSGI